MNLIPVHVHTHAPAKICQDMPRYAKIPIVPSDWHAVPIPTIREIEVQQPGTTAEPPNSFNEFLSCIYVLYGT